MSAAIGLLIAVSALPMVALFPEPPASGRGAADIVSAVAILATLGTSFGGRHTANSDIALGRPDIRHDRHNGRAQHPDSPHGCFDHPDD